MTDTWWIISTDGPYHHAGDVIVGPCTYDWASDYRRASAAAVMIVPGAQVTDEQKQRASPGNIEQEVNPK